MGLGKLEITSPVVILGEGAGDRAFFQLLCDRRGIQNVQCIEAGGSGKFAEFLKNIRTITGFNRVCRTLIVVADNDDTPDANFNDVRRALKNAKLPQPNAPLTRLTYTTDPLGVAAMMVPFDGTFLRQRGCLETIILEAVQASQPMIANCVPAFGTCVGADTWTNGSHLAKFRLRAILAAFFSHDPNFSLQYAVATDNLFSFTHQTFDPLVAFIRRMQSETP